MGLEDPLEKGQAIYSSILGLPLWLNWYRIYLQCGRPGFDPWLGRFPVEGKATHSNILVWRIPWTV